jgi:hypothetical protein
VLANRHRMAQLAAHERRGELVVLGLGQACGDHGEQLGGQIEQMRLSPCPAPAAGERANRARFMLTNWEAVAVFPPFVSRSVCAAHH